MLGRASVLFVCFIAATGVIARASHIEPVPVRTAVRAVPDRRSATGAARRCRRSPTASWRSCGSTTTSIASYYAPARYGAGLYIGYYRSQRQGDSIHSPLNCMPGAGWEPVSQRPLSISVPNAGADDQHLGESLRDPEGHRPPARAVLVSKSRTGRGERVLEQVLSDSRRGSPQPHRCGAGTGDCADARPIWSPANQRPRSRRSSSSAPCFRCCPPTCLPESRPCTSQSAVPSSFSAAPPSSAPAAASLRRRNTSNAARRISIRPTTRTPSWSSGWRCRPTRSWATCG